MPYKIGIFEWIYPEKPEDGRFLDEYTEEINFSYLIFFPLSFIMMYNEDIDDVSLRPQETDCTCLLQECKN